MLLYGWLRARKLHKQNECRSVTETLDNPRLFGRSCHCIDNAAYRRRPSACMAETMRSVGCHSAAEDVYFRAVAFHRNPPGLYRRGAAGLAERSGATSACLCLENQSRQSRPVCARVEGSDASSRVRCQLCYDSTAVGAELAGGRRPESGGVLLARARRDQRRAEMCQDNHLGHC